METDEYLKYRTDLLNESKDEEGFISESHFLDSVLPLVLDSKLIDTEDYNESYYLNSEDKIKINGYSVTESGERLQIFIVNEESISLSGNDVQLQISLKAYYDAQFNRAVKFIQSALSGKLNEELQDADGVKALIAQITSPEGLEQYDTIEIFLISATATVETRGATIQPKSIEFDKDKVKVSYRKNRQDTKKEISVSKKLVDLNFLYTILISQGKREPLTVDFEKLFNYKIEAIKAADEEYFESYLCVLPGNIISELYKEYSTRMLEKNVRSFLSFPRKGVNSGIKDTITDEPEKFIAYNNGLTITSTGKETCVVDGKLYIKSLSDFQIVNGGQTTATIYFTQKEGISIDRVKVMAKINIAKRSTEEELDKLITNISTFSNAQTRVSKVDLRARSSQLVKIKALSESIVTPKGLKWFFERAKGELNTAIRKGNKEKIIKKFPKERRFTKEELAKYYSVWGNRPFLVKLGGEKVFREFIEELSGDGAKKKAPIINRIFFENMLSRIILFRSMEKIYGDGKKKIGNLRAAVIPYSVSVLYNYTDGETEGLVFDFNKIWIREGLETDLSDYLYSLMVLMNSLIKKYSTSDDPSENSKTKDLWERIFQSKEIDEFMATSLTKKIIKKYTITKEEYKRICSKNSKTAEVNFKIIQDNISIHTNGVDFYKKLSALFQKFSHKDKEVLDELIYSIIKRHDIDQKKIDHEMDIINKVMAVSPEIFDILPISENNYMAEILEYIISVYNNAINNEDDIQLAFKKVYQEAKSRGLKDPEVWERIGQLLVKGDAPKVNDIFIASSFISGRTTHKEEKEKIKIDESLLLKMVEWDSKKKVLSNNERQYLSEFAYGFKKLNPFHERNCLRYLEDLIKAGLDI